MVTDLQEDLVGQFKTRKPKIDLSRPSIDLDTKATREWRHVPVKDLQSGDIVADIGLVHVITQTCGSDYYFRAGEGEREYFFSADYEVFAFVRKAD